ncbi:MAG: hypothetical protein ACAI43_18075, partial [Phycisphaerae bacterium]
GDECLNDFHWLAERVVVLVHADLPRVPARVLALYLDVLAGGVGAWSEGEAHEFRVVFPPATESEIAWLTNRESARVDLTRADLLLVGNALNEVCNGVHIDDSEFFARLGASRDEVRVLLRRVKQRLGEDAES